MDKPGRAKASVSGGGNNRMAFFSHGIGLFFRSLPVLRSARSDIFFKGDSLKPFFQQYCGLIQQGLTTRFAVPIKTDGLSIEILQPEGTSNLAPFYVSNRI
jgi:hypothetical protein